MQEDMNLLNRDWRPGLTRMEKQAVILAGGFGTRLKNVVRNLPKSMAVTGKMPFLTYLFEYLQKYDIKKVILAVGYKYEMIFSYFGYKYKNIEILYSIEEEPLGTGGAILKATDSISSDYFFVINGDTYFNVDLDNFKEIFEKTGSVLSVALKPMGNFDRYGSVTINRNRITSFNEKKQSEKGLINGGTYLISKAWLIDKAPGKLFSFEKDLMEKAVNDAVITYYISDTYFIDIGIPEDYERAAKELPRLFEVP
jgi:D-glycero-alpha-D-manno-heptose 1-phosphate guanylyltransferase